RVLRTILNEYRRHRTQHRTTTTNHPTAAAHRTTPAHHAPAPAGVTDNRAVAPVVAAAPVARMAPVVTFPRAGRYAAVESLLTAAPHLRAGTPAGARAKHVRSSRTVRGAHRHPRAPAPGPAQRPTTQLPSAAEQADERP
ncbi:MAG TPA: hypothetical protein VF755_26035, partial [Catenuloplanes sp.]